MAYFNGILPVDKPPGFTSFDVVAKLRGMTRVKRVGHSGTLDPMATGVLPVFFDRATKAIDLLSNHDKTYAVELQLGIATDTYDTTGRILSVSEHSATFAQVRDAALSFVGEQEQIPPMYSAVKVNGRRLYDIARTGAVIEREARPVNIYDINMQEPDEDAGIYKMVVRCSKGTYVRSLCHDIGQKLGCGGAMKSLRRTEACGFTLDGCITLEQAQSLMDEGRLAECVMPVESAFSALPVFTLDAARSARFLNGLELRLSQFKNLPEDSRVMRVHDASRRFLGLAEADFTGDKLKIIKLFALGENQ